VGFVDGDDFLVGLVGELAGELEGGADFVGVVGVVAVDVGGDFFEAPGGTGEGVEGLDDLVGRDFG